MGQGNPRAGSAMISATIVVIMVIGLGGAFLADTVFKARATSNAIEADEVTLLAESALEKTRRALYVYKTTGSWTWDEILAYCDDPGIVSDPEQLRQEFLNVKFDSVEFQDYREFQDEPGIVTANDAPLPGEADFFFGEIRPYGEGGFHVMIHDNDDFDDDPLHDSDGKLLAVITAVLPDGSLRQLEALLEYDSGQFDPDMALLTNGSLSVALTSS